MNNIYRDKVELLLRIMPLVMEEECFAVHGGTAINLFVKELPRLSVDIDLTYIPLEDRNSSLQHINDALMRIATRVKQSLKGVNIIPRLDISKLTCEYHGRQIKIEVNQTKRGIVVSEAQMMPLCDKAQDEFQLYTEARIVPMTQLYGGKIAAALSRQHPRDLFDVAQMNISIEEAKLGLIFCLLGSDRPLHESFAPNLIDQREAMENQFVGMSDIPFGYDEFEQTRSQLIEDVKAIMNDDDKKFLVGFELAEPDWTLVPYAEFAEYPSVKWKLMNLQKLKKNNPDKLKSEAERLKDIFEQ